jgi:hypothetical protein
MENSLSRRGEYVYQDGRAHAQSILLAWSFRFGSFLLPAISQTCSQLIHTRFRSSSPAGLRLEISCESDKKKMNFIFNYGKKNSLDWKNEARVSSRKPETAY